MAQISRILGFMLVTLSACGPSAVQMGETTEAGHTAEAAKERAEAQKEQGKYDPQAERDHVVGPSGPAGTEGASGVLITLNPTAYHLADADAHARHAKEHEAAAAKLAKFEDVACADISEAERASCPTLLSDTITVLPNGIRLRTGAARLPTVLRNMQCTLAFAHARGYSDEWLCPFAIKGVTAAAAPDQSGVDLTSKDPAAVAALHALVQLPHRGM